MRTILFIILAGWIITACQSVDKQVSKDTDPVKLRETVQEQIAGQVEGGSAMPDFFAPLLDWVGLGHTVHMFVSYLSAVPLAWALTARGLIPDWLGWAGAVWGVLFAFGFMYERFRFVFSPPIWAHLYTLAVGIALLV